MGTVVQHLKVRFSAPASPRLFFPTVSTFGLDAATACLTAMAACEPRPNLCLLLSVPPFHRLRVSSGPRQAEVDALSDGAGSGARIADLAAAKAAAQAAQREARAVVIASVFLLSHTSQSVRPQTPFARPRSRWRQARLL